MTDRLVVVTGTSAGIGEALKDAFLTNDWNVIGVARRAVEDGSGYRHVQGDLGSVEDLEGRIIPTLRSIISEARWARVALVNNAAVVGKLARIETMSAQHLAEVLAINTVAPLRLMGLFADACPQSTPLRIVNVSSGAAVEPFPGLTDYCTSKAALHMAGRGLVAEADESRDLAVLSWEPGIVESSMQEQARARPPEAFPSSAVFHHFHEAGMTVRPEDVTGDVVAFCEDTDTRGFTDLRWDGN